jgi:starvation-inducible outer membrane lipoprotein
MRLKLILAVLILSGCQSIPRGTEGLKRDATASLIRHPQFNQAAKVAPQFVSEALNTITALEAELELKK